MPLFAEVDRLALRPPAGRAPRSDRARGGETDSAARAEPGDCLFVLTAGRLAVHVQDATGEVSRRIDGLGPRGLLWRDGAPDRGAAIQPRSARRLGAACFASTGTASRPWCARSASSFLAIARVPEPPSRLGRSHPARQEQALAAGDGGGPRPAPIRAPRGGARREPPRDAGGARALASGTSRQPSAPTSSRSASGARGRGRARRPPGAPPPGRRARASAESRRGPGGEASPPGRSGRPRSASWPHSDARALGRTLARALRASPPLAPDRAHWWIERLGDDARPGRRRISPWLGRPLTRPGSPPRALEFCGARSAARSGASDRDHGWRLAAEISRLAFGPWASIRSPRGTAPARDR